MERKRQVQSPLKSDAEDFKVFSLDEIERAGFKFKVSANNYDGGVLIFAKNDFLNYSSMRYFPRASAGKEWVDGLVNTARSVCRHILDEDE